MNKIVAIVGMAGSGKSIASSYFNNKGYNLVYFGGVIYEKMKEDNGGKRKLSKRKDPENERRRNRNNS